MKHSQDKQHVLQNNLNHEKKLGREAHELAKLHEKSSYYDGKIFYASDKATYTFVHEEAVVILHLDALRNTLYLNGHKITSLLDHNELPYFLEKFKKCLAANEETHDLLNTFNTFVLQLENN